MHFRNLVLQNFGPFGLREFSFRSRGLHLIDGQNASGKTQITGAFVAALVGAKAVTCIDSGNGPSEVRLSVEEGKAVETLLLKVELSPDRIPELTHTCETGEGSHSLGPLSMTLLRALLPDTDPGLLLSSAESPGLGGVLDLATVQKLLPKGLELSPTWRHFRRDYDPKRLTSSSASLAMLLTELVRRTVYRGDIPLIVDGFLDQFGGTDERFCIRILETLAERSQVILLSSRPHRCTAVSVTTLGAPPPANIRSLTYFNSHIIDEPWRLAWVRGPQSDAPPENDPDITRRPWGGKEEFILNSAKPVVLLLGPIGHEGILSALKSTGRQYKTKMLDSTVPNWESIIQCFDDYTVSCVLGKLTTHSCRLLGRPDYAEVRNRLFQRIGTVPNLIFVYENLLFGEEPAPSESSSEEVSTDATLESIREYGIELVPYRLYAEVTTTAGSFLEDTERNLIFRLYVPSGRLWSAEADRFLQLFQDYLSKVRRLTVRLDHKKTDHGSVYEFHGEAGTDQHSVADEFREFSHLMDLCASDGDAAARLLTNRSLPIQEVTRIVEKYSKEARRLQLDLKHEAESRMIALRHRVESDLMELGPTAEEWQAISSMIAAAAPQINSILPAPSLALRSPAPASGEAPPAQITYNVRQNFIQTVNGIVADEMNGTQHFGSDDRTLLEFVRTHARENSATLETAVYELADNSGRQVDKRKAGQKLKAFLVETMQRVGKEGVDIGFSILHKIIEKKMGL